MSDGIAQKLMAKQDAPLDSYISFSQLCFLQLLSFSPKICLDHRLLIRLCIFRRHGGLDPIVSSGNPIFAKAPCLELFGCCYRRLSQHGAGEVLIPVRHCWQDAFFCVYVGSGSFCRPMSHCSVCFGILMRCLFLDSPLRPQTPNAATLRVGLCMSPGVQYHPVNIYLKPDESFVYIGE